MTPSTRFKALTVVLALLGLAVAWLLFRESVWPRPMDIVVLLLVTAVAEHLSVSLPVVGTASLSFVAIYAALILYGGFPAILVSLASAVTLDEIRRGKPSWSVAFNVAQEILATGAAGLTLQVLEVHALMQGVPAQQQIAASVLGWILACAVMGILNPILVMLGASCLYGLDFLKMAERQRFSAYLVNLVILGLLGLLTALVFAKRGWLTAVVLLVPFVLERQALSAYMGLLESYSDTLRLLVSAIESKDSYTRGHSERVAEYSVRIAERLGVKPKRITLLERAALLHDIGKIGVATEILCSPGRLSASQYEDIKKHPIVGADLVESIEFLREAAPIIAAHHERIDGQGYPQGVTEAQIPLESRILACADAFDAMTTNRPYRSALPMSEALEEILRESGKQFDPVVSIALAEAFRDSGMAEPID